MFVSPEWAEVEGSLRWQHRPPRPADMANLCALLIFSFFYFTILIPCIQVTDMEFCCEFLIIPQPEFDGEFPSKPFDIDDKYLEIARYCGNLSIDFAKELMEKGLFKMSHPERLKLDDDVDLPPFTNRRVCVKQIYEKWGEEGEKIGRLPGRYEADALSVECNVLQWASILLDMMYQFIEREITVRGEPRHQIPQLRFTKTMVALVKNATKEKAFLVEEWINTDEIDNVYTKYITNRHSQSIVPLGTPQNMHNIASFLVFAQHVQWQKTHHLAFTLDYQRAGLLLSDPQIVFCTGGPGVFLGHPYPCPQKTVPEVAGAGTLRLRARDPCGIPCSLGH